MAPSPTCTPAFPVGVWGLKDWQHDGAICLYAMRLQHDRLFTSPGDTKKIHYKNQGPFEAF